MIITIKSADFSTKNIGTLSTWTILTNLGSGATYSGNRLVDKDGSLSATITIADGYELGSAGVSVIMGATDVTSSAATVNGNIITISIATVTGNVTIKVPTLITGGEEIPNYAFTINPTPSNAIVTLTASGYTQNGNSITVPNGTTVSWSVSADGYTEQTGSWTANGENKTENVVLSATGGDVGTPYYFKDQANIGYLTGGEFVASPKSATTDYIDISSKPKIGYYGRMGFVSGQTYHALEFYDVNKNYLVDLSVLGTGVPMQTNIDLSESKYANAKYVRASVSPSTYSQEDFDEWYFMVGSFIEGMPTLDTLKNMFPQDGYLGLDGDLIPVTTPGAHATDYISLNGKTNIEYKGRMGVIGLNVAFYNSSEQLISGLETVGDGEFITLNINLGDANYANAAYVRASISRGALDEAIWFSSSFKIF